jgi:hypothetical protein
MLVLAVMMAGLLGHAEQVSSTARPAVPPQATADWTGVAGTLTDLAAAFRGAAEEAGVPVAAGLEIGSGPGLDLRAVCHADARGFASALLRQRCSGGACGDDAEGLVRLATQASGQVAYRLLDESQPALFLSSEERFEDGPETADQALSFGAAADLRLRQWSDGLLPGVGPVDDETRAMLLFAWCRLVERNRSAALAWIGENGFPSDSDVEQRRLVPVLIYTIQHSATHPDAVSAFRDAAEARFLEGKLSSYFMAQILDVERSAHDGRQVVGSLTSCEGERAIFDPPLLDEAAAENVRRDYGLPPGETYLRSISRRCAPPQALRAPSGAG